MNIPNKIIEAIEALPMALRPELFFAVICYMQSGSIPAAAQISVQGMVEFDNILKVLNPILHRRRQQAEYRRRRKEQKLRAIEQPDNADVQKEVTTTGNDCPATPALKLNRRQRRAIERVRLRKIRKRPSPSFNSFTLTP